MALSSDEATELASLTSARMAWLSGQLPSRIVYNGQETDFAKLDAARLDARIAELNAKAASSSTSVRRGGAVRFRL